MIIRLENLNLRPIFIATCCFNRVLGIPLAIVFLACKMRNTHLLSVLKISLDMEINGSEVTEGGKLVYGDICVNCPAWAFPKLGLRSWTRRGSLCSLARDTDRITWVSSINIFDRLLKKHGSVGHPSME